MTQFDRSTIAFYCSNLSRARNDRWILPLLRLICLSEECTFYFFHADCTSLALLSSLPLFSFAFFHPSERDISFVLLLQFFVHWIEQLMISIMWANWCFCFIFLLAVFVLSLLTPETCLSILNYLPRWVHSVCRKTNLSTQVRAAL